MKPLLEPAVQDFIKAHEHDDEQTLLLKAKLIHGLPARLIIEQIVSRRKAKTKLPEFYTTENLLYPPSINIEQCSSQATALFKSKVLQGNSIVDLTGGYGVDSYYFSKLFHKVIYVEPDNDLLEIVRHNHQQLKANNISHINSTAERFLTSITNNFDVGYLDPSRRKGSQKISKFSQCTPDVTALLPDLKKSFKTILIKASPLLDITQGSRELKHVSKVYIVAVENECKELLFLIQNDQPAIMQMMAVDLSYEGQVQNQFEFTVEEEQNAAVQYADPQSFLYEPSAAMLKAGAFKLLSSKFSVFKLASNTHLYTSEERIDNFPGKIFQVETLVKPDAKTIKQLVPELKANITTRNYPLTPAQLKKKLKLNDGGEKFLIAFSGMKKKFVALAHRIK